MTYKRNIGNPTAQQILRFIWDYNRANGYPPTYEQIEESCSLSPQTVKKYMIVLEDAGYIQRPGSQGAGMAGQKRLVILKDRV